jgi:thiol-disulfide isomerase/thioredoxin
MKIHIAPLSVAILALVALPALGSPSRQQMIVRATQDGRRNDAVNIAKDDFKNASDDPQVEFWMTFLAPNTPEGNRALTLLRGKDSDGGWTVLAKAARNPLYGASLINQALTKVPSDPGFLQAATRVMMELERGNPYQGALKDLLKANTSAFGESSDLLVTQAYADQMVLGEGDGGAEYQTSMFEALNRALKLNPLNEDAEVFKGRMLRFRSNAEAYSFLKDTASSFPDSYPVKIQLWSAALAQTDSKTLQPTIQADITQTVQRLQPSVVSLRMTYAILNDYPEIASALTTAVLARYPDTGTADEARYEQAKADLPSGTPETNAAAKIDALEAFIKRPIHPDPDVVQLAEATLEALLAKQPDPDLPALYAAVEKSPTISRGLRVLAQHKYRLPDLERIAEASLNDRWTMLYNFHETSDNITGFVGFIIGDYVHFAETSLGLVFLEEGKLQQAQEILEQAVTFSGNDSQTSVTLAQVYQAKGDYAKARSLMLDALSQSHPSLPENPAIAALPELYKAEHHGTAGLDEFMKPLLAKAKEEHKRSIVAERLPNPRAMPPLQIMDLTDHAIDVSQYKGKILVVNFWATWCGPCRAEFPEFQKLYTKYKDDPRIAFVAVSTDSTDTPTSSIASYIDKNHFTFPVARGADYATTNHINNIPLTWWVNPEGKIAYSKLGGSQELVEEFTWRIDALESGQATAANLAEQKR